jgi:hypothetical protein
MTETGLEFRPLAMFHMSAASGLKAANLIEKKFNSIDSPFSDRINRMDKIQTS